MINKSDWKLLNTIKHKRWCIILQICAIVDEHSSVAHSCCAMYLQQWFISTTRALFEIHGEIIWTATTCQMLCPRNFDSGAGMMLNWLFWNNSRSQSSLIVSGSMCSLCQIPCVIKYRKHARTNTQAQAHTHRCWLMCQGIT